MIDNNRLNFTFKFLVNNNWEVRTICSKNIERAREISNKLISRQFGNTYIPVTQILKPAEK